ncbi:NAD-glutamate dehydrogenase [Egicoccus halophilus]|uniref:NAD-glutamate dehydrogenase n=1 Tax=Egicoccus halophilus TaxID=1670830 RepID=UPI001E2F9CC7|nr:NAD-glutamate dehydrogenase domain-containing protein [Egicoccus halophilus]
MAEPTAATPAGPDDDRTGTWPEQDQTHPLPASTASHERVLTALADLDHDRPEVLQAFARAALRRVPAHQLRGADAPAAARRLLEAFTAIDRRREGEINISLRVPPTGLDGRPALTSVVEVASEDRPFLLSTVTDELERLGYRVVRSLHPIVGVERDPDGRLVGIVPARTAHERESLLHLELGERLTDDDARELCRRLRRLVDDVMIATSDYDAMRARIREVGSQLAEGRWSPVAGDEQAEVAALLDWLLDENLIVLGIREYELADHDGRRCATVVAGSGLGLLRDESTSRFAEPVAVDELPASERDHLERPQLLTVTRTNRLSTVQRRVRMEYFGLSRVGEDGQVVGEFRILGLFTRKGYTEPARTTPVLREKLRRILEAEDVVAGSHDEITLLSLFQALPKDELFQSSTGALHRTLVGLLHAEEHREIRTLTRIDHHTRTVSVLIAVPRDVYSPQLRERLEALLTEVYGAERIDVEVSLGDRNEALTRFLLQLGDEVPEVPLADLQQRVRALARSWLEELRTRLRALLDEGEAHRLTVEVGARLPRAYRDTVPTEVAVQDVVLLDRLLSGRHDLLVRLQQGDDGLVRLKAAKLGTPLELSGFLPILESLGLVVTEEIPHPLERTAGGEKVQLHDFGMRTEDVDVVADGPRLADAVLAAWRGHLEVDSLNRLVLRAGLSWRDVALLRAYRRYRRQVGTAYTPEYVNDAIVAHPEVVRALLAHFSTRFDPHVQADDEDLEASRRRVVDACDRIDRLDHDRILRGMLDLIEATLRTNAFREDAVADGSGEPYVAFKMDPARVPGMPTPAPYREIFVHSPRVEGVHLRGGPVARGGLRWSDRKDDVRTEVLDLVKAQMLKNALIVPTGAKGGFVLMREPDSPEARRDEVRRQYVTFVRGLLDVTDDLAGDDVVGPTGVVRRDGDDHYLVVAADRGTATFSDTANELARRYGFWLDDAFASGGSNGYDHKALGVTAKGAWVAVQRHFRELGVDVQIEPISVVGIGDMSGDVFGNGMLRSRATRLVAAFDHRHIFLDPDPDPEVAFAERERLFGLPGSSWDDYDRDRLSAGGGIHPRSVRAIPLSDEVRALLRVDAESLSPPELIRAVLRAPVDLLFAGGIGTYVKSSSERHDEVGDRTNDEVRVDASDLRARVIAEGANLSITQRGRIEYARHGGRVNQDAIDNAAGVSTSDHEVNLKILLTLAVEDGRITQRQRDDLLAELADDVVDAVLCEVDRQAAALSQELARSPDSLDAYGQLLTRLETTAGLDRDVQILPGADELAARAESGAGLLRPELATLLAWAKRDVKEQLLASPVPDQDLLQPLLADYFPDRVTESFADLLPRHRLRRELIATMAANDVVDRMGVTFPTSLADAAGVPVTDVVLAYVVAREEVDAPHWWDQLEAAQSLHDPQRALELEQLVDRLVARISSTVLLDPLLRDPASLLDRDRPVAEELRANMLTLGTPAQRRARVAHARWLVDDLVHPDLARFLACAGDLAMIPDVAYVLARAPGKRGASDVADAFLRLGETLGIDRIEQALERAQVLTPWARRQRGGLANDLRRLRREAAHAALERFPDDDEATAVRRFLDERPDALERVSTLVRAADNQDHQSLDAIAVAARTIRDAIDRGA